MSYYVAMPDGSYVEMPDDIPQDQAMRQISLDPRFRPIIEKSISEQSSIIPDLTGSVVRGFGSLPTAAGRLTELVPGMQGNLVSRGLISAGEYLSQRGTSMMSPGGQMQQQLFQAVMDEAENQGLVDQAKVALREAISNPRMLANITAESIPSLVASFGGGLAVRGAAAVGSRLAGRQLGAEGARRAAVAGAIGTESLLEGGGSADDVYKQIKGLPEEELQKSPEYQGLLRNMSPDEARESLARSAARQAGLQTAAISGTIGAALPGVETMPFARASTAGRARRALTGAGTELVQEAGQEGGAAFSENLARQRAEIERELTAGVGSRAALGAVVGGITGGAFGGLRSQAPDVDRTEDAELRRALRAGQPEFQRAAIVERGLNIPAEDFLSRPVEEQEKLLADAQKALQPAPTVRQVSPEDFAAAAQGLRSGENQEAAIGTLASQYIADQIKDKPSYTVSVPSLQAYLSGIAGRQIPTGEVKAALDRQIQSPENQSGEFGFSLGKGESKKGKIKKYVANNLSVQNQEIVNERIAAVEEGRVETPMGAPAAAPEGPGFALPPDVKQTLEDLRKGVKPQQQSLVQFLRKVGGLNNTGYMAGEISNILGSNRALPGLINNQPRTPIKNQNGKVVGYKGGLTLDAAVEKLQEAGYLSYDYNLPGGGTNINDMLNAIREELSGGAINYGRTEDFEGQERQRAARQLERALDEAGVSARDSDEDIARALGFEAPSRPVTAEDVEALDRERFGNVPPKPLGPAAEYSARGQPGQAPQTEQAAPQAPSFDYMAVINDRLNKIRAKGKQGEAIAAAIEKDLRSGKYQPEQLYAAFKAGEVMAGILPSGANHEIRFVERVMKGDREAEGRRWAPIDTAASGIIEISLSDSVLGIVQETAAHEAFHVLQDYYGQYDPAFKKLMGQSFKDGMTLDQVDSTIKRKLQTIRMPGSKDSYWDFLTSSLPGKIESAREAEAYVFGSLHDAAKRGIPMTGLKPAFTRFVNMLTKFTRRMGNALRGDGFNSPDDIFGRVVEGDAGRFAGEAAPPFRNNQEAEYSSRNSKMFLDRVSKYAKQFGFQISESGSSVSESKYLDAYDAESDRNYKIRISGHDLPPSYGPADFDIDSGRYNSSSQKIEYNRAQGSDWFNVVASLAEIKGAKIPSEIERKIKTQADEERQKEDSRINDAQKIKEDAAFQEKLNDAVKRAFPAEWNETLTLPGRDRREGQRLLRRKYWENYHSYEGYPLFENGFPGEAAPEFRGGEEFSSRLPAAIEVDGVSRPTTNSEGRPIHPTEEGVRNFWRWFGDSKVVDADGKPLVVYHGTDAKSFDKFKPNSFFSSSAKEASAYANTRNLATTEKGLSKYNLTKGPVSLAGSNVPYFNLLSDIPEGEIKSGDIVATDEGVFRSRGNGNWDAFTNMAAGEYQGGDLVKINMEENNNIKNKVMEYNEYVVKNFPGGKGGRVVPAYLLIQNPVELDAVVANRLGLRLGATENYINEFTEKYKSSGFDGIFTESDEAALSPEVARDLGGIPKQYIPFNSNQIKSATGNTGAFSPGDASIQYSARTLPKVSSAYQSAIDKVTGTYGQQPDSLFRRALDGLTGARAKYTYLYGGDKPKRVNARTSLVLSSVNQAYPAHLLDQLVRSKGRPDLATAGRSWEASMNNDARIAWMMNGSGYKLNIARGVLERDPKIKSMQAMTAGKVSTEPTQSKAFQTYLVASQERDLRKQGKAGMTNLTDAEINAVIRDAEKDFPAWKEVKKDLNDWNNSLLQILMDAGVIDKETKDRLMSSFYTPLYRTMENDAYHSADHVIGPATAGTFKNPSDALKKREGGEDPIGDLFENIVRNADAIVKSALKNVAMRNTANAMEFAGLAQKLPTRLPGAKNILTIRENGKDVHYRIDDPLMMVAISTAPPQIQNSFVKALASFSGFIRNTITLAPPFMLANLWRGRQMAYVQEGVPFFNFFTRGFKDTLKQTAAYTSIGDVSGFGGYTWGQGGTDVVKELKRRVRMEDGTASMLDRAKGFIKSLENIGEITEFSERTRLVNHLVSKGVDPDEAAFQAYLLAPYSRRGIGTGFFGGMIATMAPLVPFLNAKIQGTYRLMENEKNLEPKKFIGRLMARGAMLALFSLAAAVYAADTSPEEWDKEPVERKMLYDIAYVGGGRILFPRSFEVGTWFGAIPVMVYDALRKQHGGDLGKAFAFAFTNTLGFSPIPAAADPMLTVMTNYDFFRGRELESAGMKSRPVSERVQEDTSRVAEGVAYAINNSIGQLPRGMKMELSPMQAQSLLQGYLGTTGVMILSAIDGFLGWTGVTPGKPAGPLGDPNTPLGIAVTLSGMRRFVKGDEEQVSRFVGDFYDLKREVTQWTTAMNDARLAGDMARANEIASERSDLFSLKRQVDKASRDVGEISRRMRAIQNNPNMDPQEKADALVPLRQRRNEITGRIMELAVDRGVR